MNPNGSNEDKNCDLDDRKERTEKKNHEEADNEEEEKNLRIFACDLIQNAGILLKLPQVALATAQMLLHRVYHTTEYTFGKYCLDITAMACLFLAAKIEEYPRKVRDVIDVFTHVISSKLHRDLILSRSEHERVRSEIFTAEKRVLKNLGFNLLSNYPHKMIVTFYNAIVLKLDPESIVWRERDNQQVLQLAWNYCNDSLRLDIFNCHSKEAVACACIHLACEDAGKPLPRSTDGRYWYCLFVASEQEVLESIEIIKSLYERARLEPIKLRRFLYLSSKI